MFEVDVKNVTEGRRRRREGPARVWGSDWIIYLIHWRIHSALTGVWQTDTTKDKWMDRWQTNSLIELSTISQITRVKTWNFKVNPNIKNLKSWISIDLYVVETIRSIKVELEAEVTTLKDTPWKFQYSMGIPIALRPTILPGNSNNFVNSHTLLQKANHGNSNYLNLYVFYSHTQ